MNTYIKSLGSLLLLSTFLSCEQTGSEKEKKDTTEKNQTELSITYEKFTLDNGLEVILHEDHSDPIVAVATLMHVGSNREKPGKTGFAHFFEHMSFNDSENVPVGANRKMIPEWGGERNGGTWGDGTIYYEVVPKDAFDKILWIDSDRFGYMINTVTEAALEREKQVVKNEKRQRVDNSPYGYTSEVIKKNLYPEDHPYNWTTIGQLPDLQAATLADVKEFYEQYYGANNATLVIAGDIDIKEAKEKVTNWFGEIRKGPEVQPLQPMPVTLEKTKSLYFEDNFAKLPELRMVFPTVEQYHKDTYALEVLSNLLSGSKKTPFYKILVEEKKLAPRANVFQNSSELAGEFGILVRANAGVDLDSVKVAIDEGLQKFEEEGFDDNQLKQIKAEIETDLYQGFSTVLNKAFQLAEYNEFQGDPGYIKEEAKLYNEVSREDIERVYNKYIKGQHYIMTSFVPKGNVDLAVNNAEKAEVWIEEVKNDVASEEVSQGEEAQYEKTVTKFDRSEPDFGELPLIKAPEVWTADLSNGIPVYGIENNELPLIAFDITIKGGHLLDPIEKSGISDLMSSVMMQGTATKTPAELEEAIGLLGASINMSGNLDEIRITANCLAKNLQPTLALVKEILLEPRWDEKEFDREKQALQTGLKDLEANPRSVAYFNFIENLYGADHLLGIPYYGSQETVKGITLADLKAHYKTLSSKNATVHIAGAISEDEALKAFETLGKDWNTEEVTIPQLPLAEKKKEDNNPLYFIDVPGSKQSVLYIGDLALSGKDPDYNNLDYAIEILGGGSSGRLFQTLRIEKGYTYGASAYVPQNLNTAPLIISTSVRSNATLPSLQIIKEMVSGYKESFGEKEVEITKNKVLKSKTRAYEDLSDKLRILREMSKYNKPASFVEKDQQELLDMDVNAFKNVIDKYLNEKELLYIVVGDKATQWDEVKKLGKEVIEIDTKGKRI